MDDGDLSDGTARPRMPAGLVVAALAFLACGGIALTGKVLEFLKPPDPYAGTSIGVESGPDYGVALVRRVDTGVAPGGGEFAEWFGWLIPILVLVLAVMIRGGGNVIRVSLTVFAALFALGVLSALVDNGPGGAGILLLALITMAVVLLFLPWSNAYVRAVRARRQGARLPG